jgi:hypothetical protein
VTFGRLPFGPAFAFACTLLFTACTRSALWPAATPAPHASNATLMTNAAQLPGGGTTLFPHYRVVAFYGAAGVPGLGVLGQGAPRAAAAKLLTQAHAYAPFGRFILPAFELIATIVQQEPGASGTYSVHASDTEIGRYLAAARRIHALLILDIQPGYRSFAREARHYEKYLVQPDIGLALDSEWSMNRGDVPGKTIGHTTARIVNDVSRYLARLVATHRLPQKLLAIHLFSPEMVSEANAIAARPGLAVTFHIDGFGARGAKRGHYRLLHRSAPFFNGFKLFFQQDIDMLSAADVMHLHPPPDLITYE